MGIAMRRMQLAVLILASGAVASTVAPGNASAQPLAVASESPAAALARNVRILVDSPKQLDALIGAGKAALELGDTQSAAGFFGRAEDVNSNSPLAEAGMGAALVATGNPTAALTYFARAQALGARPASIGCDRGLAYDLLGNQVAAQTDYRAALMGPDRDEARRRLALSLAISGKASLAISTLQPLIQLHDQAAQRVRALVLALDGNLAEAKAALDYTMPGASARMDPFFRRLPTLTNVQKAAAVHLGIFPESGAAMAAAPAPRGDRLASIDQLLTEPRSKPRASRPRLARGEAAPGPPTVRQQPQPVQVATVSPGSVDPAESPSTGRIQTERVAGDPGRRKIWLQLASGTDTEGFNQDFRRIRSREPSLFTGLSGWVADAGSRARLLIGPFHSNKDAQLFADALADARIDSSSWTSQPGEMVRKLTIQ